MPMDELKVLLKLSDKLKGQNEAIHENKVWEFENAIRNNLLASEEELKSLFFKGKKNNNYYGVLKSRLYQELFNRILVDSGKKENINNRLNKLFDIQRKFIVASILLEKNERVLSIKMFEKLFKLSKQWEYTLYTMLIAKNLYTHYAFVVPNKYKMLLYKDEFRLNEVLFSKENHIYAINAEISHLYQTNRSGIVNKNLEILDNLIADVKEIHSGFDSYSIKFYSYDLLAFYYLTIKEYDEVIHIAESGKKYFLSKNFKDIMGVVNNNVNIINAYIYKGMLEDASLILKETFGLVTLGTRMWVRLKSFEFIIYTIQKNYEALYTVYLDTKARLKLEIDKEEWLIRSAYIHFLIRAGKVDPKNMDTKTQDSFVLTKFLNSVPFFSKDKSGQNISIIIVQMLFYFLDKKWDKVLDKIDGLRQYSFRYLNRDESMRSNCFIKMLIAAEKANFNRQLTVTYTKSLYEKMISSPYVLSDNSAFVEIVPYETLWELTLELLPQSSKKISRFT